MKTGRRGFLGGLLGGIAGIAGIAGAKSAQPQVLWEEPEEECDSRGGEMEDNESSEDLESSISLPSGGCCHSRSITQQGRWL